MFLEVSIFRQNIDALVKTQKNYAACKQPKLPVDSPEIMKFVKEVPKIDCSKAGEDWVKCEVCSFVKEYFSVVDDFFVEFRM